MYDKDVKLILSTNLYPNHTREMFRSEAINEINENIQIEVENFLQSSNNENEQIINFPISYEIISQSILEEERTMINQVFNDKLNKKYLSQ